MPDVTQIPSRPEDWAAYAAQIRREMDAEGNSTSAIREYLDWAHEQMDQCLRTASAEAFGPGHDFPASHTDADW